MQPGLETSAFDLINIIFVFQQICIMCPLCGRLVVYSEEQNRSRLDDGCPIHAYSVFYDLSKIDLFIFLTNTFSFL